MITRIQGGGRRPLMMALAAGIGLWVVSASSGMADSGGSAGVCSGKPDASPSFQGFGLGYKLGYGYGGDALGVGAGGGYPFYGGPGYPHPWPCLQRIGGITPFPDFMGSGGPAPGHPNFFGGVGPLAIDPPIVTVAGDPRDPGHATEFGPFTGVLPYPESTFAPYTTSAGAGGPVSAGSSASAPIAPATSNIPDASAAGRFLGLDADPVVDAGRARGLKVTRVQPGSAAARAGLHPGDMILSINGYVTDQPGNVLWIIAHAAPDHVLKMSARTSSDGEVHTITAQLP